MNLLGQSIFLAPIQKRKSEECLHPKICDLPSIQLVLVWAFDESLSCRYWLLWTDFLLQYLKMQPHKNNPPKKNS